jgi:hypothetical protein
MIDRSRLELLLDHCWREFYYLYEHDLSTGGANGIGIVPKGPMPVDLAYGLAFHEGAQVIAEQHQRPDACIGAPRGANGECPVLTEALAKARAMTELIDGTTVDGYPRKDEYYALAYGHLRTFHDYLWPRLIQRYEVLACETEMVLPLSRDLIYSTRLDLGVRDRASGMVYNWSYKTDSSPDDIRERMQFHMQHLMEDAALAAHLGERCYGTIIFGIDKGSKGHASTRDLKAGKGGGERRLSPFTYGFVRDSGIALTYSSKYQSAKGWERFPVWLDYPGGSAGWYDWLLEHEFDPYEQFVEVPPILFDDERYESVKRQIVAIDERLHVGRIATTRIQSGELYEDDLFNARRDAHYPQNFLNCQKDGGYKKFCPYIDLCHGAGDGGAREMFKPRVPNHPIEVTLQQEAQNAGHSSDRPDFVD